MTVKKLKELLANCPDDFKVVLIDEDSFWQTGRIDVTEVEIENDEQSVLIF